MTHPFHDVRARGLAVCALLSATIALAACGGGGSGSPAPAPAPTPVPAPPPPGPTAAQRIAAATATATSTTNDCPAIAPFYWEVGDQNAAIVSGSVNSATDPTVYTATSVMAIASASKWLYGGYVAQKRGGVLSASDIKFLTFQSGYTDFDQCLSTQSIAECVAYENNGVHNDATDGYFAYGGGHMENHASLSMGLGALRNADLTTEVQSQIGTDIHISYTQPQLAGGVATSAADYALFLRKLLGGQLQMGALLGTHAVCTNPNTCAQAIRTPVPSSESWHYSIGHWVEDDPVVGDGAFSSAGAFGFYPWIDATKTWYGVLARRGDTQGEGFSSADCGREIRKAFVTGIVQ